MLSSLTGAVAAAAASASSSISASTSPREPILSTRGLGPIEVPEGGKQETFSFGHENAKLSAPPRKRGAMFAAALGPAAEGGGLKPLSKEETFDAAVIENIAVSDALESKIEALRATLLAAVNATCDALRDRATEVTGARTDALEAAKKAVVASAGTAAVPSKAAALLGLSSTTLSGKAAKLLGEGDPTKQVPAKAAALLGLGPAASAPSGLDFSSASSSSSAAEGPGGLLLGALAAKTDDIIKSIVSSTEKALRWEQRVSSAFVPTLLDGRVVAEDSSSALRIMFTYLEASLPVPSAFGTGAAIGWKLELLRDEKGTSAAPASGAVFASVIENSSAPPSSWAAELVALTEAVIPLRQPFLNIPASTAKLLRQYGISAVEVRPVLSLPRAKLTDDDDEGDSLPSSSVAVSATTEGGASGSESSTTGGVSGGIAIAPVRRSVKSLRRAALSKHPHQQQSHGSLPPLLEKIAGASGAAGAAASEVPAPAVALEVPFAELAVTGSEPSASNSAAAATATAVPARRVRIRLGLAAGDMLLRHVKPVSRALPVLDGSMLVAGDLAGHVSLFCAVTGTKLAVFAHPERLGVTALCELATSASVSTKEGAADTSSTGSTLRVAAALENGQLLVLDFPLPVVLPPPASSSGSSFPAMGSARVVATMQGAEGFVTAMRLVFVPAPAGGDQEFALLLGGDAGGRLLAWNCSPFASPSSSPSSGPAPSLAPAARIDGAPQKGASVNAIAVILGSLSGSHVTLVAAAADDGSLSFFSVDIVSSLSFSGGGLQPQFTKKLVLAGAKLSAHGDSVNDLIALSEDVSPPASPPSSSSSDDVLTRYLVSVGNDKTLKLWKVEVRGSGTSASGSSSSSSGGFAVAGVCEMTAGFDASSAAPACVAQLVDPSRRVTHAMRPSGVLIAPVSLFPAGGAGVAGGGAGQESAAAAPTIKLAVVQAEKVKLCELKPPTTSSPSFFRPVRTLQGHQDEIGSIAPFGDGRLVTSASDCLVRLWSSSNFNVVGK